MFLKLLSKFWIHNSIISRNQNFSNLVFSCYFNPFSFYMPVLCTHFAYICIWVHDVYLSLIYRLQAPPAGGQPPGPLRVSTNGPGTSPNQLPESTTAHFGLKVEPYSLDPSSPPFIDPITGEVAQRPHTTHVSPPAVVTSSMIGPGSGSGRYKKSYKLTTKSSNNSGSNGNPNNNQNMSNGGYGHHGPGSADTNSFLTAFGSPNSTSPFDPTNPGLSDQVSYGTYLEVYAAHHLDDDGITKSKQNWRTMNDNFPSTVCHFLQKQKDE